MDLAHARNLCVFGYKFCFFNGAPRENGNAFESAFHCYDPFNAEELIHIERNLSHSTRKNIRAFLKKAR